MKRLACFAVGLLMLTGCASSSVDNEQLAALMNEVLAALAEQQEDKPPVVPPVVPPVIPEVPDIAEPDPPPVVPPVVPPTPPPPPTPSATPVSSLHGSGFIWKPISENEAKLVVITPVSWPDSTAKIGAETLRFTGRANGNRAHYRASKAGSGYPANTILTVAGKRILIPNPALRYD